MKFRIGPGRRSTARHTGNSKPQRLRQRNLSPQPRVRHKAIPRSQRGRANPPVSRSVWIAGVSGLFLLAIAIGIGSSAEVSRITAHWWTQAPTRVHSIAVTGQQRLDAAQVASATGLVRSAFLENLNPLAIEQDLEAHAWIETAEVITLPSGQVLVKVEEREPSAILHPSDGSSMMWVDRSGTPFALAQENEDNFSSTPRLIAADAFAPDEAHIPLAQAIALLEHIASPGDANAIFSEVQLPAPKDLRGWLLRTRERDLEVILGSWEPAENEGSERFRTLQTRLTKLRQVLAGNLSEGKLTGRIDLRFKDQAIWIADVPSVGGGQPRD